MRCGGGFGVPSRSMVAAGFLLGASLLSGCLATNVGFQYLPERAYYVAFEEFQSVEVQRIRHVREHLWGVHVFGFQLKRPNVRGLVESAIGSDPSHYVCDLNIYTEIHATLPFTALIGMYLPRVTIDFDVLKVRPPSGDPSSSSER